jgi:hypothetical protein
LPPAGPVQPVASTSSRSPTTTKGAGRVLPACGGGCAATAVGDLVRRIGR